MSLLNLTAGELIAIFGALSAVLVTLYMLDRSRRKQVVATFRFWRHAEVNVEMRQKRHIQQPWSLILQLISMGLILLAIAQLQWGSLEFNTRDHVLILDTSAWMAARSGNGTLMDQARTAALAYVKSVPSADRILLVRADGLATPATPVNANHAAVEQAIRASRPSSSALNLDQALAFARRAQTGRKGEITYVGASRVAEGVATALPQNLRVLTVKSPEENCGIRRVGLKRSTAAPDQWEIFVSTRNYGTREQVAQIAVQFAGAPIGNRPVVMKPGTEQESTFTFRTKAAGWIEARLLNNDAFQDDNRVVLELPPQGTLRLAVYTDQPDLLRPVFAANARVSAQFLSPSQYKADAPADAVILDRFVPPAAPRVPSIWIEPPAQKSPVTVRTVASAVKLSSWNGDHEIGSGLRTRDLKLDTAEIFEPAKQDAVVAASERGPVILAREPSNAPKMVVLGFNPVRSAMKYELATPILFANLLNWLRPELFRRWELNAGTVGMVEAEVDKRTSPDQVRVAASDGHNIPYTIDGSRLRFFAAEPGNVTVQTGDRQVVYSLTLPEVGTAAWQAPASVRHGLPRYKLTDSPVTDLWPWLALAGMAGLFAEWWIFGRGRSGGRVAAVIARSSNKVLQRRAS